jgi:DNA-binding response OmpR family regulator
MQKKTILIVDDEKNIRLTLSATLESVGLQTDTAVNGEEALEKIGQQDYDLMLLDIKMPGMDGIAVLAETRKIHPKMPVIMITAHGTIENAVEAMKLGAVDFIQKPFAPKEIRELVTKVLERQNLREDDVTDYDTIIEFAKKCILDGRIDDAVRYVREAVSKTPQRPEAFNFLGILMEMQDQKLEALKLYRASSALDPTYAPARKNLSRATAWESDENITLE